MPALRSILVPVDFSEVAANAYAFALRLADNYPAQINLLYCMPPAVSSPGMDRFTVARTNAFEADSIMKMDAFRKRGIDAAINELTGVPDIHTVVESGELTPTVNQLVASGKADLIVMGTAGQDKYLSDLVGTNATYLIDEATVPVLIVPNKSSYRRPHRICYAGNPEHVDPLQVTNLFDLFAPFNPVADFVYVGASDEDRTADKLEVLRRAFDCVETGARLSSARLKNRDEVDKLLRYAETSRADVVVMNRSLRASLEGFWMRSHTHEAILKTEVPLLIMRRP